MTKNIETGNAGESRFRPEPTCMDGMARQDPHRIRAGCHPLLQEAPIFDVGSSLSGAMVSEEDITAGLAEGGCLVSIPVHGERGIPGQDVRRYFLSNGQN